MKYLISILMAASFELAASDTLRLSEMNHLSFITNKTEYTPGDSILIHYWVIDPTTQQPTSVEGGVTFQLLNSKGEEVGIIRNYPDIRGSITFLETPAAQGLHYLRAYTDEMLNIGDTLIPTQPIYINTHETFYSPIQKQEIKIHPEGGNFVLNHNQRLVIQAPGLIGDSVYLYDNRNQRMTETTISDYGNALIIFTPKANTQYTLHIRNHRIPIEIETESQTLKLTQNNGKILYSVLSSQPIEKANNITLNIYTGNKLLHSIPVNAENCNGTIDVSSMENHVLLFRLSKNNTQHIAQRAIFINSFDKQQPLCTLQQSEDLGNTFILTASSDEIDPNQSYRIIKNQGSPLRSDLLPPTFKLRPKASDYIDETISDVKRNYLIDLLMIQESSILAKEYEHKYTNGYSNKLSGKVKKSTSKNMDKGKVMAFNTSNNGMFEAPLSLDGNFEIHLGVFVDSTTFYFQAYNDKGRSNHYVIDIDPIFKPGFSPQYHKQRNQIDVITAHDSISDIAFEDVIPEVDIVANKKKQWKDIQPMYDGTILTSQQLEEHFCLSLADIIRTMPKIYLGYDEKNLPAVYSYRFPAKQYAIPIMIDNVIYEYLEAVNMILVSDTESVEYIDAARAAMYGAKAIFGLVKIDTKKGWTQKDVPSQGIMFYPKGFSPSLSIQEWAHANNQNIVVSGKDLQAGVTISANNTVQSILVEGFDKSGKIIQQQIFLNE